jgi:CDP-paratose 2-epimerase
MKTILITGGAGFIGTNAAARFGHKGWHVIVLDNLSRRGAKLNIRWLRSRVKFAFHKLDIRDAERVDTAVSSTRPDVVLHLAAQVAVTRSLIDPRSDFSVNALGTLNVLESVRTKAPNACFLLASTNKVYGRLGAVAFAERAGRYELPALPFGVSEAQPLDFCAPYGCSKGAADQYALDFYASYGLRTAVFRQSCIYGSRQFGTEDQGWVAWFLMAALLGKPVTIYGDGKQVRDVLHVDDLIDLYEMAAASPDLCAGGAFNVGGGPANTLSVNELATFIQSDLALPLEIRCAAWRTGDQPVFVSDISRISALFGWRPRVNVRSGLTRLYKWMNGNRAVLTKMYEERAQYSEAGL